MLDRILQSPLGAVALMVCILILGGIYLVNRERAHVQRMKGPRRFQPDWSRSKGPRRRRRRRSREFRPAWNQRVASPSETGAPGTEDRAPEDTESDPGAPSAG